MVHQCLLYLLFNLKFLKLWSIYVYFIYGLTWKFSIYSPSIYFIYGLTWKFSNYVLSTYVYFIYGLTWNLSNYGPFIYTLSMVQPENSSFMVHLCLLYLWFNLKVLQLWSIYVYFIYGLTWKFSNDGPSMFTLSMV